jgi:hypothetical protein
MVASTPLWAGKLFSAGWRDAHGGAAAVMEPATDDAIGHADPLALRELLGVARARKRPPLLEAPMPDKAISYPF